MKKSNKKIRRSFFTLVEVVIVIVILVTLASVAVPLYMNHVKNANIGAAKTQIKLLADAVNQYKMTYNKYPESLKDLVEDPGDVENWKASLQSSNIPKDPWGNEYVYQTGENGRDFEIISYGADGEPEGEGENADLNNWTI